MGCWCILGVVDADEGDGAGGSVCACVCLVVVVVVRCQRWQSGTHQCGGGGLSSINILAVTDSRGDNRGKGGRVRYSAVCAALCILCLGQCGYYRRQIGRVQQTFDLVWLSGRDGD